MDREKLSLSFVIFERENCFCSIFALLQRFLFCEHYKIALGVCVCVPCDFLPTILRLMVIATKLASAFDRSAPLCMFAPVALFHRHQIQLDDKCKPWRVVLFPHDNECVKWFNLVVILLEKNKMLQTLTSANPYIGFEQLRRLEPSWRMYYPLQTTQRLSTCTYQIIILETTV